MVVDSAEKRRDPFFTRRRPDEVVEEKAIWWFALNTGISIMRYGNPRLDLEFDWIVCNKDFRVLAKGSSRVDVLSLGLPSYAVSTSPVWFAYCTGPRDLYVWFVFDYYYDGLSAALFRLSELRDNAEWVFERSLFRPFVENESRIQKIFSLTAGPEYGLSCVIKETEDGEEDVFESFGGRKFNVLGYQWRISTRAFRARGCRYESRSVTSKDERWERFYVDPGAQFRSSSFSRSIRSYYESFYTSDVTVVRMGTILGEDLCGYDEPYLLEGRVVDRSVRRTSSSGLDRVRAATPNDVIWVEYVAIEPRVITHRREGYLSKGGYSPLYIWDDELGGYYPVRLSCENYIPGETCLGWSGYVYDPGEDASEDIDIEPVNRTVFIDPVYTTRVVYNDTVLYATPARRGRYPLRLDLYDVLRSYGPIKWGIIFEDPGIYPDQPLKRYVFYPGRGVMDLLTDVNTHVIAIVGSSLIASYDREPSSRPPDVKGLSILRLDGSFVKDIRGTYDLWAEGWGQRFQLVYHKSNHMKVW